MKWNNLKYILSLLLVLFIIIILKTIIIKEGARNRNNRKYRPRNRNKQKKRKYKNKIRSTNPYQNILDDDQGMLLYYQTILEEQRVQYSDAIKTGSSAEILHVFELNMAAYKQTIDFYEKKIVEDKEAILANTPSPTPLSSMTPTKMTPTPVT